MAVFDIVKMETRVARMIGWLAGIQSRITDFLPGGKTRTKLEAVALELEQQDYQVYQAIKKAIPIALYAGFSFPPLAAVRASGNVTFSAAVAPAQDVTIPKGTLVATTESTTAQAKTFETSAAAVLAAGQTSVVVPILCTVPGSAGNTGVGTVNVIKTTVPGIDTVTNVSAITNGTDVESETARSIRFREYIASLSRGTAAALEYAAKTARLIDAGGIVTERVVQAKAYDAAAATAGFADVFVHNGTGSTSAGLITEAQKLIDGYTGADGVKVAGYKAAGIVVTVAGATELSQDVTVTVTKKTDADAATVEAAAEAAASTYIASLKIGEKFVYHELVERIMAVAGVYDVTLAAPTGNVAAQQVTAAVFTGTGLDDMTAAGPFTGSGKKSYVVEVDGTGAPDTFKWSRNGGETWAATTVPMVAGTPVALEDGVAVTFAASTGHTIGDKWAFTATSAVVFTPGTIAATVV